MINFFSENDREEEVFFHTVRPALAGLIYISETDSDVVPFVGPRTDDVTSDFILSYAGLPANEPVEEKSPAEFFERFTAAREWHGERENERTKKFLELQRLLEGTLSELKVFRVGHNPIDIFVVGRLPGGRLAGVRTRAVET